MFRGHQGQSYPAQLRYNGASGRLKGTPRHSKHLRDLGRRAGKRISQPTAEYLLKLNINRFWRPIVKFGTLPVGLLPKTLWVSPMKSW